MQSIVNAEIDIYALLLLFVLYANMFRRDRTYLPDHKLFFCLWASVAIMLCLDSIQWIIDGTDGRFAYYVNLIGDALYYIIHPIPCALFYIYARYQIKMDFRKTTLLELYIVIPVVVNAILAIMSLFNGMYFYVDDQNYYHRGDYFWITTIISYAYFVYTFLYVMINRKLVDHNIYVALATFALPPLIAGIFQFFSFGFAPSWPCAALSIAIIYLNIQKNQLYTDHLTGLYNRRLLDMRLESCLKKKKSCEYVGVIMMDIDAFKAINDNYGHLSGDKALIEAANIIKRSIGKKGFIARYGGDEFVVLSPVASINEIEDIIKEIKRNEDLVNMRDTVSYKINLSKGYELFACDGGISAEEALCIIDRRMYEDKSISKKLNSTNSKQESTANAQ